MMANYCNPETFEQWVDQVSEFLGLDPSNVPENFGYVLFGVLLKYKEEFISGEYNMVLRCYIDDWDSVFGCPDTNPIIEVVEIYDEIAVFKPSNEQDDAEYLQHLISKGIELARDYAKWEG